MSIAVRAMFDQIAPTYDVLNRTLSFGIDRLWRRRAVDALGDLAGETVLDLCAGTMDLAAQVGRRFPTARVLAADFARAMLQEGRDSGKLHGVRATTMPVQADALSLPLADASFGAALCAFGIRNLDDPAAGLAEMRRVLRPGGRLAILELFKPTRAGSRLFHDLYNRSVLPAVGGLISRDRSAYQYLVESMERFWSLDECLAASRSAGLSVVEARPLFPGAASLVVLDRPEEESPC